MRPATSSNDNAVKNHTKFTKTATDDKFSVNLVATLIHDEPDWATTRRSKNTQYVVVVHSVQK